MFRNERFCFKKSKFEEKTNNIPKISFIVNLKSDRNPIYIITRSLVLGPNEFRDKKNISNVAVSYINEALLNKKFVQKLNIKRQRPFPSRLVQRAPRLRPAPVPRSPSCRNLSAQAANPRLCLRHGFLKRTVSFQI